MSKEVKYIRKVGDRTFLFETYEQPLRTQIKELKQQLKEKDKEINQLKQEKKNAGEEKARAYLDTLTKPKIIELCLQYINDKNIAEQQLEALMLEISKQEVEQHDLPDYCTRTGTDCTNLGKIEELQQQLAEKQNTINEINKEFVQAVHDWKTLCAEKDKEISKLQASYQQVKTQLAIQELEKVKDWLNEPFDEDGCFKNGGDLIDYIDQQIKELKGEKE